MTEISKPRTWSWLLLFTTSGTLLCCALPITLVALGMGSVVASMASTAPWLITLSLYKGWMFFISLVIIGVAAWAVYRPGRVCPTDPELALACERADKWNRFFVWCAGSMWLVGFAAAFVLPRVVM